MTSESLLEAFQQRLKGAAFPCLVQVHRGEETILSASALWISALKKKHALRAAGMRPGDIWLQEKGGTDAWIHFFACLQGGFIFCPLALHDSGHAPLVSRKVWSDQGSTEVRLSSELAGEPGFALLLHTSGTSSGRPRCVRLESAGILHQLQKHQDALQIPAESNRWLNLPWFHSFGFILDGLLGLYAGQYLYMFQEPALHPRLVLDTIQRYEINWLAAVPRSLQLILQYSERHPTALSILQNLHVHSGGAWLDEDRRRDLSQCLRAFYWGYGLTECGPGVLLNGHPIGCEVKLKPSEKIQQHELWVRGPSIGRWASDTRDFVDGWLATGDLAVETAPHTFDVIGRAHDCFKTSAGVWIHLREIELMIAGTMSLLGVHISLQSDASHFVVRLLAAHDAAALDRQALNNRLQKILPLPVKLWISQASDPMLQNLLQIPQKSLGEALGRLPLDHFMICE